MICTFYLWDLSCIYEILVWNHKNCFSIYVLHHLFFPKISNALLYISNRLHFTKNSGNFKQKIQMDLQYTRSHLFTLSTARRMSLSDNDRLPSLPRMPVTSSSAIPGHDLSARSKAFFSSSAASVLCTGRPLRR